MLNDTVQPAPAHSRWASLQRANFRRSLLLLVSLFAVLSVMPAQVLAADQAEVGDKEKPNVLPSVSHRFAVDHVGERPDFQRHVVPLLSRLGCNGRACHGSFQGQGGLQLSLFGYDFQMDHQQLNAVATSQAGSRINGKEPAQSLILQKPTMHVPHEGGQRFEKDSWQYRVLERWIADGAAGNSQPDQLATLSVQPTEVEFRRNGDDQRLRVVAEWADGSCEDVTALCRFRTNDDSVAIVSQDGLITSTGLGDTNVIAFYDNGVAAVSVIRPYGDPSEPYPQLEVRSAIDRFIQTRLQKLNIVPSELCSDAEFLRRATNDLTGSLPTPQEVQDFLASSDSDKRIRKIDELLARDDHAAWWANRLCDYTGCNPNQQAEVGQETAVQWYTWIYERLKQNLPYNELVRRIATARSRADGESYDQYATAVSKLFRRDDPGQYADRPMMAHYWSRRSVEKPEEKALAFAHSFLGIRLQCAQCHKHPFAPWTQRDFDQFSQFFSNIRYDINPADRTRYEQLAKATGVRLNGNGQGEIRPDVLRHARNGRTVPWREVRASARDQSVTLDLLHSGSVTLQPEDDGRLAIMDWMERPDNPWFATAFVNRVWAGYFGRGIVEPPDDLNAANPPSNPALLSWLAEQFVAHNYDMKWLHRTIVSSDAYQRSWKPNPTNRHDDRNFSRSIPRRIPAEVVYDAVKQAVAADDQQHEVRSDLSRRAIGHLSMRLAGTYAMHVFGKPERSANCDCERVNQPTLLQAIFLQNDPLIDQRLQNSGWLDQLSAEDFESASGRRALIQEAWLRTVNRPATSAEVRRAESHLLNAEDRVDGLRDVLWALLNTREFILNH